ADNANSNSYSNSKRDSYSNCYGNANAYSLTYGHADGNGYYDTEAFTHTETGANAQAASYSAAAPLTCVYEKETHCSICFRQSLHFHWGPCIRHWNPSRAVCLCESAFVRPPAHTGCGRSVPWSTN